MEGKDGDKKERKQMEEKVIKRKGEQEDGMKKEKN
jgi:hypothetical protein